MGVYLAKPKTDKLTEEGGDLSQTLSAFGVASMQGWRQTMEDAHIAVPSLKRCCPVAIEALRALEQEQRKAEAEGKLGTVENRKDVSVSSGTDTAAEEKDHQDGKQPADTKQAVDQDMRSSSTDTRGQCTTQQAGSQTASSEKSQCAEDVAAEDISLYAVFDGHASNAVSCWVSDHYLKIFAECLQRVQQEAAKGHMPEGLAVGPPESVSIFNLRNAAICEALQQSFLEVDEQMQEEDNRRALKKYYEEGQMEQKDDETYIQKYLSDGGDVRLVEMEGQKFLQFVPKTTDDEDEAASKDSDEHGGDTSASPVGSSSPAVEQVDTHEGESTTAASEERTSEAGQQQHQQGGESRVMEGEKEKENVQEESETPSADSSFSSANGKDGDSNAGCTDSKSCATAKDSAANESTEAIGEKDKDVATNEAAGSTAGVARHITRFNSTGDMTSLGGTTSDATAVTPKSQTEQTQQSSTEETRPEEEKKRTAGQAAGEEDVDMEDAHAAEERRDSNKRERRRRKEDPEEDKKTEEEGAGKDASQESAAALTEEVGTAEKPSTEEEDGAARADSGDEDDDDGDDVFGRRESGNGGERTPLFAHPSTPEGSGATAVVVLVVGGPEPVVVTANAGDSRGVICRGGQAFPLSHDHKPTNPDEKARIFAAGGSVTNGRVDGNLNLSRAVGDLFYKRNREVPAKAQRITAFPDVRITRICEDDEFLILACDGIWDCKTNQEAVDFVRERLQRAGTSDTATLRRICEELCDDCLAEDPLQSEGHGCDNMTCLVVELSSHVKKHRARALRREEKIVLYGGGDDKYLGCEEKQFESDDNED